MSKKPDEPRHVITFESLVAWGCKCGGRWNNDHLRGKRDDELVEEREASFMCHVRTMEKEGF